MFTFRSSYCTFLFSTLALFFSVSLAAKEIKTNAVTMTNAPDWVKRVRVDKVTDRIQTHMEWTIRRINVYWYRHQADFEKAHSLGSQAIAVTIGHKTENGQTIHLGPKVTSKNFDGIFAHELVHVSSMQKYKDAIPKWLEEGLASHLSKKDKVDYQWLAKRPFPEDVRKLTHPYSVSGEGTLYHYRASQALIEMLQKKCDLANLLRLSVQRKMENYIETYCEIKDLNASYRKWVKEKSSKI